MYFSAEALDRTDDLEKIIVMFENSSSECVILRLTQPATQICGTTLIATAESRAPQHAKGGLDRLSCFDRPDAKVPRHCYYGDAGVCFTGIQNRRARLPIRRLSWCPLNFCAP